MSKEAFHSILAKEKSHELVPYLQSLDKDGKKELAALLKSLAKEYLEYKQSNGLTGLTYKQKASAEQKAIIYAAAFVVYNRKEYEKLDGGYDILNGQLVNKIFEWYHPEWFSASINELAKQEWMPWHITYEMVMTLADRGVLNPSDELIARLIPMMIFDRNEKHQYDFHPENLIKRPITCDKHVWLIFSYETTINHADNYNFTRASDSTHRKRWLPTLKQYCDNGAINRQRLLRESLLATCRNFTKPLSGWFVELFELMEPSTAELVDLQPELIIVLGSQNSKAVNLGVSMLKKILEENAFNKEAVLDNSQVLLSSDTKSVVSSALTLFEKIGRQYGDTKERICLAACQAFIHNDESIQQKAAKLILKFYKPSMDSVRVELENYSASMLMSSKKALEEIVKVSDGAIIQESPASKQEHVYDRVQEVSNIDQLIFLASQAFDNNDPAHIDLLPAALVNLQNEITGATLEKFEPALQRAYNFIMGDWPSTMGYLDHLLATFFIDTTRLLIARYPEQGASLQNIHQRYEAQDRENANKWKWYNSRILQLATWVTESRDTTYIIYKALLLDAYSKIESKAKVPMLSTPTHQHGFLDPVVLVSRLQAYQISNVLPDDLDFQVAISRLAPFNHLEALAAARKTLNGETLRIMEFLLDKDCPPAKPYHSPTLWFMAALTKDPHTRNQFLDSPFYDKLPRSIFTGEVEWKTFTEHFKTTRYNFETKKNEDVPGQRNILKLYLPSTPAIWKEPKGESPGILSKIKNLFTAPRSVMRKEPYLVYEYFSLKAKYLSSEHNDVQRFISLAPSNPNPILALVTSRALENGTFASETEKKLVTKTLEALIGRKFYYFESTNLFLSACLIASDKTVKSLAAELWIAAVNDDKTVSSSIGKMIGKHLGCSYAPMKRFTDLVASNLMKVSPRHDLALLKMIEGVIEYLGIDPPTGTKRLIELYSELIAVNNVTVSSLEIKSKLQAWSASSSMKKAIEAIN